MSGIGKALLFCLLGFVSISGRADQREINSTLGIVDIVRSSPESSPDTLRVAGQPVYVEEGTYVGLYEKFSLANAEVVLFGVNCGGTGCPNDDLHFLILPRNGKAAVVSKEGFYSLDGTVAPKLFGGKIIVDLGYEDGKRKTAELSGGAVSILRTPQPVSPMSFEHCQWLHEYSMSECIGAKSFDNRCESPRDNFSGATSRGVAALSNHPGFVASAFDSACLSACQTGEAMPFATYKKVVCSIR